MYLKSIEVQGFKSFANKTVFQFHNGITGIVGPNGSGKSNVADAVRWVLGEQRVKQLRGGSMQDVIFAGTETRKPLGYAYVAITLSNEDHSLPISYDEITVARRLYRSGESEYLLNGTQCRLKDVHELFYDTGIGKEGYSIIGQGQIEKILSGKPEERRELFDEAAGIVKYKRRKLEAQKKLDDEQLHLTRVNDILSELRRQVGPLERQSEKAKQYLDLKEQLKAYDVNTFLVEYQENKDALQELNSKKTAADDELTDVQAETAKIKDAYASEERRLEELESSLQETQERISSDKLAQQMKSSRIELLQEQIRTGEQSLKQSSERLKSIEEEGAKSADEAAENEQALAAVRKLIQSCAEQEQKQNELRSQNDTHIVRCNEQIDECGQQIVELLNERTDLKSQQQRLDTLIEQSRLRRSTLSSQILQLKSQAESQQDELAEVDAALADIHAKIEKRQNENDRAQQELEKVQEELLNDSQRIEKDQAQYHTQAARLESLRNMAERYDGYGSSIRRVMERKIAEPGIHGVVADLIRTDKQYETAVETALGGSIQNIVTSDEDTAKRMIAYLKENKYGRATFLPLTAMNNSSALKQKEVLAETGVIGIACDLVTADKMYSGLLKYLLGKTVVVDNIDHTVALARKFKYSLRIVTLEGELLNAGGSMTGGAFKNSSNLLGRRRELDELAKTVGCMKKALDDLRNKIDSTRATRNRLRDQIRELNLALQDLYLKQNTANMQKREIASRQNVTEKDSQTFHSESRQLQQQVIRYQSEQAAVEYKLNESEDKEREINDELDEARITLKEYQQKDDEIREAIEGIHLEAASAQERVSYLEQERNRLLAGLAQLEREKKELQESEPSAKGGSVEKTLQVGQLRTEIEQLAQQIARDEAVYEKLQTEKEQRSKRQKQFFMRREELTERESLLDKECFRLASSIEKLEESSENRIAYMWEEYGLTYSSAQPLRRDDLGSKAQWKKMMSDLKKQIKDLGNVNVNAIEEYKEVSERCTFLSAQHDDLVKAEADLRKIIDELDKGMRERFISQFSRIAQEFDKTFRQLFGGGKGSLELVEDEDILETGIRIIAQPPGKKLQNMMQMSGGEKALTAIALLFAIQNLKPSPFCLLDEIEAALDENNVSRYANYLHKLTKNTQFIIITHRRGTMAAADRLYGITMQEKGVSALVSVNLIESELDN